MSIHIIWFHHHDDDDHHHYLHHHHHHYHCSHTGRISSPPTSSSCAMMSSIGDHTHSNHLPSVFLASLTTYPLPCTLPNHPAFSSLVSLFLIPLIFPVVTIFSTPSLPITKNLTLASPHSSGLPTLLWAPLTPLGSPHSSRLPSIL